MKTAKFIYKRLITDKHHLVLAVVLILGLLAPLSFGTNDVEAAGNPPGIKRCENKKIKNTEKCKLAYRGCAFTAGGQIAGKTIKECRDETIANFMKSSDPGGGDKKKSSGNAPGIKRCERDDIDNTKQCKKAYRKCDKDEKTTKAKTDCKKDKIKKHTKPKKEKEKKKGDPAGIGDAGEHTCGTYENQERNVKTRFDFGCLGTDFAKNGQGRPGISPILDLTFAFVRFMSIGVGIVLAASMIMSGIQYSMSEGNAEITQKAKARIRSASMGFIIYLFAYAILQFLVPGGAFNGFWLNDAIIQSTIRLGL